MKQIKFKSSSRKIIRYVCEFLSDVFWPKKCIVCNCRSPLGQRASLCDDCKSIVKKLSFNFVEPDRYFEEAIAALPYDGNIRNALMKYKFYGFKYLRSAFSTALKVCLGDYNLQGYSLICPTPIHKLRNRDYNQSLVIANELSQSLNIPFLPDLLIKTKNLSPLSKMGYSMRRVSVKGAIDFNLKYDIFGKSILLVDDIYTTGSTADECSMILRMHGAAKVTVLAACYANMKGGEDNGDADNIYY